MGNAGVVVSRVFRHKTERLIKWNDMGLRRENSLRESTPAALRQNRLHELAPTPSSTRPGQQCHPPDPSDGQSGHGTLTSVFDGRHINEPGCSNRLAGAIHHQKMN